MRGRGCPSSPWLRQRRRRLRGSVVLSPHAQPPRSGFQANQTRPRASRHAARRQASRRNTGELSKNTSSLAGMPVASMFVVSTSVLQNGAGHIVLLASEWMDFAGGGALHQMVFHGESDVISHGRGGTHGDNRAAIVQELLELRHCRANGYGAGHFLEFGRNGRATATAATTPSAPASTATCHAPRRLEFRHR